MPKARPASPELLAAWFAHRDADEAWVAEMRRLDPWCFVRRDRDEWSRGEEGTTLRTLWEASEAARKRWEAVAGK